MNPLFLTHKLTVNDLSSNINVYDFQLQDHFLNNSNLYTLQCACPTHKHNKQPCVVVNEPVCLKCNRPTKSLLTFQSAMFHNDICKKKISLSDFVHTHTPPCEKCLNCQINLPCIVPAPFECNISTG